MEYHFQIICLPFCLSTSPRTFSKVLLPFIVILHRLGLQVFHYLDHVLLVAQSPQVLIDHRESLVQTLLVWMANQLAEEPTGTHTEDDIPGGSAGHLQEHSRTSDRESSRPYRPDREVVNPSIPHSLSVPQFTRVTISDYIHGKMGSLANENFPGRVLEIMEKPFHTAMDQIVTSNEAIPRLVAETIELSEFSSTQSRFPNGDHIGCISDGLGSTPQQTPSPRSVENQAARSFQNN